MNYNTDKYKRQNERLASIKQLIRTNKLSKAMSVISEYMDDYPDDDVGRFQYANVLFYSNKIDDAEEIFNDIISNSSSRTARNMSLHKLGKICFIKGDFSQAMECFLEVINNSDNIESASRNELSQLYLKNRQYEDALAILAVDSDNDYMKVARANIYFRSGNILKALNELDSVKSHDDNLLQKRDIIYARIELKNKNPYKAIEKYSQVLKRGKNNCYWKASLEMCFAKIDLGEYDEVIDICKEIELNPNFSKKAKLILGEAYYNKGDYELSRENYLASRNDKNREKVDCRLGKLELTVKNYDKAKEYFLSSLKNTREYKASALYGLLLVSYRKKDYGNVYKLINEIRTCKLDKYISDKIDRVELYIDRIHNKDIDMTKDYTYDQHQIISYSSEKALEHIIRRHGENSRSCMFNENIDISSLFFNISDYLNDEYLLGNDYLDTYIVPFKNIGYDEDGISLHKLEVVTLPNSSDVITMFPYRRELTDEYSDSIKKAPQKRLSQIEKFNARYNRK